MGDQRVRARARHSGLRHDLLQHILRTMLDRDRILKRLETDLVGPLAEDECLSDAKPSDVYLTGILWPRRARRDGEEDDRLDSAGTGAGTEDDTQGAGEEVPLAGLQRPCT